MKKDLKYYQEIVSEVLKDWYFEMIINHPTLQRICYDLELRANIGSFSVVKGSTDPFVVESRWKNCIYTIVSQDHDIIIEFFDTGDVHLRNKYVK